MDPTLVTLSFDPGVIYIVMIFAVLALLFVNFFVKAWALSAVAFFLSVGVVLMPGTNEWLQYGFIIVLVYTLLDAVRLGFKGI